MRVAPSFLPHTAHRRRHHLCRRAATWVGLVLFSPFVVLGALARGRAQVATDWVRGFLLLGVLLLLATGVIILESADADQQVFAALGRFEAESEQIPGAQPFAAEVNAAASHYGLNPTAVEFVVEIESDGRPMLVSPQGACGLMQIMPRTWRALNPRSPCRGEHQPAICGAGDDCIFSSWGNIRVGTLYLSRLLRQYHGDYVAALQAYNAGQSHVVFSPEPAFPETKKYVAVFLRSYRALQRRQLAAGLAAAARWRGLVRPLCLALAIHMLLATALFWRRHRLRY